MPPEYIINYKKYSLAALDSKRKVFFISSEQFLKPLFLCIKEFMGKKRQCILYDRAIGLAAAKLIAYSGMFSEANCAVASEDALAFLKKRGINASAEKVVPAILNRDKTAQCPMELLAEKAKSSRAFYLEMEKRISIRQ
jgi:hypothetical protein